MNHPFIITGIDQIILVDHTNFEGTLNYKSELRRNELIFHYSGDSTVYFNGKTLKTPENTIRFLPKGENQKYEVHGPFGRCIDIFFHSDRPIAKEAFVSHFKNNQRIGSLFQKAFYLWVSRPEGYYYECISLLYRIFAEMQKQNYIPEKKFAHIRPAVSYIRENFLKESIAAEKLEALCGISYSYIKQLFVLALGVSPKKYALQLKMNYAANLLETGYSVGQVAESCGYQEISFFSRQFKAYFGISPLTYSKKAALN